jgi:predicted lipoprotein with Yx(FWY)xxD motif
MGLRPLWARTGATLAAAVAVAATAAGLAGAAASVTMKSTLNSTLGSTIVVSAAGRTLYHTAAEKKNVVTCTGSCASEWRPLLITSGHVPVAGPGVTASKLGTVKRPDGKLQVTYAGLPLYLFAGDSKVGDVKGQGVGGIWHVVSPSGRVITKAVKSSSTSSGSSTSSTGKSSGTGSSSGSSSGSSTGSSSGSSTGSSTGAGGGSTTSSDCDKDPGGYGCM